MLQIYSVPVATYCAKLRVMMRHKGIAWEELPPPGGYGSAEYKAIVPSGNLPAMVQGDFQLGDSEAIAEYLNEAYPETPMLPADMHLRAKAREKGRFHDTRLEPAVRAFYGQVAYQTRDAAKVQELGDAISGHLIALDLLLSLSPLDDADLWRCALAGVQGCRGRVGTLQTSNGRLFGKGATLRPRRPWFDYFSFLACAIQLSRVTRPLKPSRLSSTHATSPFVQFAIWSKW